jgi:hypothetical protein
MPEVLLHIYMKLVDTNLGDHMNAKDAVYLDYAVHNTYAVLSIVVLEVTLRNSYCPCIQYIRAAFSLQLCEWSAEG